MQQYRKKPVRKIVVEYSFDWEDYEDVQDELMLEDARLTGELKEGVSYRIVAEEPVSAPSVPDKKTIEKKGWKVWEECNAFYYDKGGVNPAAFMKGYIAGYEDAAVQPQSEGVLQWVNCAKSMPEIDSGEEYPVKYILECGCDGWRGDREVYHVTADEMRDKVKKYDFAQWLRESSSLSTPQEEEQYRKITGFGTAAERMAYDEGYAAHEKSVMQFVEKWNGASNSGLGEVLARKSKEQQIAFAEWMGRKNVALYESGQYYYSLKGTWIFLANNFDELYELFLTETKQQ